MASELLPHLSTTIVVVSTLLFVNAVVLEAALSFLGAGVNSIALVVSVLSLSGLAEGMRRALDPRGPLNLGLVREP